MPARAKAEPLEKVDWPAFMAEHDMHWNKLPRKWQDAPHFGNAMLGSMLYQAGNTLRLQIFRADVHDHRDDTHGWTAYSRPRIGIGFFHLKPVGKITGGSWHKDLWNAELTGTITTDKGELKVRHYVHAEDMTIVTEITPSAGERDASWSWTPVEAASTRPGYPTKPQQIPGFAKKYGAHYEKTLKVYQPNPPGAREQDGDVSVWRQDFLVGGQYVTAWGEKPEKSGRRILVVNVSHSFPEKTARTLAVKTVRETLDDLSPARLARHRDWWQRYYKRSCVRIPDAALQRLYWQTIYRYGCTSRQGRAFVDCPGIWFQGQAWCYTTTDWNIQAAHWGVCTANRLEQGLELLERFHSQKEELIKAVRPVEWQKDSAYLPIEIASDMRGNREQDMRFYWLLGDLPWALHNCWMFYRHSMDDTMLREKLFPLLRRSINFYLHMVEVGEDGKLHLPPSYSPETGTFADCNYDLALLKWGCHTLLNAAQRLNIDDPLIPRWREVIAKTVDFPADSKGFMFGSDKSAVHHRHASHLLMIYPLHLVNMDHQDKRELLELSYRTYNRSPMYPAMVQAHGAPIGASLGLGDEVLAGLHRQRKNFFSNGMWLNPPCLESSLTLANTMQMMLLQSWCDPADRSQVSTIRVFPALPKTWQDVSFQEFRTEGAFLVSAKRENGHTQWVRIKSLAGEPCRIKTDMGKIKADHPVALKELGDQTVELVLKKGETVTLYPVGEKPEMLAEPVREEQK